MNHRAIVNHLLAALISIAAVDQITLAAPLSSTATDRIGWMEQELLSPSQKDGSQRNESLTERMAYLNVPGVSIAVVHNGKIEWAKGFGVKAVGGAPVNARTLFQAASISKPITALAVMRLVQEGRLDLDADVNGYLKNWTLPASQFSEQRAVTLRRLLTHSAGVTVHGFPGYEAGAELPTTIQILDGLAPANTAAIRVDAIPGTLLRYSGGGYLIVQQVLEDTTGKTFSKLLNDVVLKPIKMRDSSFQQPLAQRRMKEAAFPHNASGEPIRGGPHVYPELAPAGLWTTPTDLARYIIEMQRSLAGESSRMRESSTARQALAPLIEDQALGPRIGGRTDRKFFMHDGSNAGYRCVFIAYEDDDGVVIMTNGDNGSKLFNQILGVVARVYNWPDFQNRR